MTVDYKAWALEQLREVAGDKKAHLKLLDDLIAWHEAGRPGGEDADPSLQERSGVSFGVAVGLAHDVKWAFNENRQHNHQPTLQYPAQREKHKRAAQRRAATTAGPSGTGLEQLFDLQSPKKAQ